MNRLVLPFIFLFMSCFSLAQEVRTLTKEEINESSIGMGMRNLPKFFFDHYYRYPENVQEFYTFLQNHYDYIEAKEFWEPLIEYLKKNETEINVISMNDLFIIYNDK